MLWTFHTGSVRVSALPFEWNMWHLAWTWGLSKRGSVHHSLRPDAYHLGGSPKWVQAERWSLKTCSVWLAKCLWLTLTLIWLFPKLAVKTHRVCSYVAAFAMKVLCMTVWSTVRTYDRGGNINAAAWQSWHGQSQWDIFILGFHDSM